MSINTMKQAIEALNEAVAFREGGRQKAIDAINALRTAIQQAEAAASGPGVLKDHQIAAMVNTLRDIARQFHGHDSLRERIANVLVPALKAEANADEPVAWIRRHPNGALSNELLIHVQVEQVRRDSGAWVPLYTHPAPGVPEQDWERKERLQSIADTAAASGLFGLAQKWADNEIHSYQFTHQAAAIVLKAMLAASPAQKGQP